MQKRVGPIRADPLRFGSPTPQPRRETLSPARTGRQDHAQVNPVGPQLEAEEERPDPARDPVRTLTEVKLRSTSSEPHWGQAGLFPFAYSDMDIRISKGKLQYWHL